MNSILDDETLLREGDIQNNVLVGKDGFLFLHGGSHQPFAYLTGEAAPGGTSLLNFEQNNVARYNYCTAHGIKYIHAVFPSKESVITDKLTDAYRAKARSLYLRSYDREYRNLIFLGQALSTIEHPFMKLDSHLSQEGKLVAVQSILEALGYRMPSLSSLQTKSALVGGDLANMLNSKVLSLETIVSAKSETILQWDNAKSLPGNTGNVVVCHNETSETTDRLLVVGDSFAKLCLTILAHTFRDILYVRHANFQPDFISLFSPDAVITANAERYLANVEADIISASALFHLYGMPQYNPPENFKHAFVAQLSYRNHRKQYDKWVSQLPF